MHCRTQSLSTARSLALQSPQNTSTSIPASFSSIGDEIPRVASCANCANSLDRVLYRCLYKLHKLPRSRPIVGCANCANRRDLSPCLISLKAEEKSAQAKTTPWKAHGALDHRFVFSWSEIVYLVPPQSFGK